MTTAPVFEAREFVAALGSVALRILPVGLVAWVACATVARRSAALRHAIWCAVIVAFVILPFAAGVLPDVRVPVPGWSAARTAAPALTVAPSAEEDRSDVVESTSRAATGLDAPVGAALAWFVVASLLLLRLAVSHAGLGRTVARSAPAGPAGIALARKAAASLGVARAIPLRVSPSIRLPIAAGVLRPAIVLPSNSAEWDATRLRQVLLHELAHIRRADLAWLTVARVVRALFWFHPLAWFACARLRAEAEQASDDVVLRSGERASNYATTLLDLAHPSIPATPSAGIAVLRRERFERRIEAIVAAAPSRRALAPRARAAVAAATLAMAALAAAPRFEPTAARAAADDTRIAVDVVERPGDPVIVTSARARVRTLRRGSTAADDVVRVDAPQLALENRDARPVRAVHLKLRTPGLSTDRMWVAAAIAPHGRATLNLPAERWSNDARRASANRLSVAVVGVRYEGDVERDDIEAVAPDAEAPKAPPTRDATPRAREAETPAPRDGGATVPAEVRNPADAPVVIESAETPLETPPPSDSEAARALDRGHDLTWRPMLVLRNRSDREVVGLRVRFKADPESHAVSGYRRSIPPGGTVRIPAGSPMWGTAGAMKVQILGVRFADGGSWGSLDSTIDTRWTWVR